MMWEQLGSKDCLSRTMPPISAMYLCMYVNIHVYEYMHTAFSLYVLLLNVN